MDELTTERKKPVKRQLEEHLSVAEIAERLGVDESTVWREIRTFKESKGAQGIGPTFKLGHRITRVPASAVNRWLEAHTV